MMPIDAVAWPCPRCGAINNPALAQCPCSTAATQQQLPQATATTVDAAPQQAPQGTATSTAIVVAEEGSKAVASSRKKYEYNDEDFNRFWEIYPARKGKWTAFRKWCGAVAAGVAPQQIIDGALRYRNDPNRDDAFTKWPEGWIASGGWDDDPLPPRATSLRHQDRAAEIAREAQRETR